MSTLCLNVFFNVTKKLLSDHEVMTLDLNVNSTGFLREMVLRAYRNFIDMRPFASCSQRQGILFDI